MKNAFRFLAVVLIVAMFVTASPMHGFVALAEDISWALNEKTSQPSGFKVTTEAVTEENLRDPLFTSSASDSAAVRGALVDVGQYYKTYLDENGKYTTVITGIPNYFKDKNDEIVSYDNTLIKENHLFSNDVITNKSSDIDISLSEKFSAEGITFEQNGVKITLIPTDGDFTSFSVVDNAIRYNNVYDGVDVQYSVGELGVNEFIILNKHIERNSFSYRIESYNNAIELVDGILLVHPEGSDEIAFTVSAPFMSDSAGEISQSVSLSLDGDIVTVTADADWLSDLNRAYPVIIDPDITTNGHLTTRAVKTSGVYASDSYGYAGWIDEDATGNNGVIGSTRLMIAIDNSFFSGVPDGIVVDSATLYLRQYGGPYNNRQGNKVANNLECYRVTTPWSMNSVTYGDPIGRQFQDSKPNRVGDKYFDISEAVTAWCNGEAEQYGLCVDVSDGATGSGAAFYTATSTTSAGGQQGFTADQIPRIDVSYELPNPVDDGYPLNDTTILLRTLTHSAPDGTLSFQGTFADGMAQPYSVVHYWLNDESVSYQNSYVEAIKQKHYPNTIAEKDKEIWNQLPEGTTKYRRFLSNWQTSYPFVNPEFNKLYWYSAQAYKDGAYGNVAESDKFLVYKITQYDTLKNIAAYYGVPVNQIAMDNHVQDMLLVENNTIVIINPSQNSDKPYNPPSLSDDEKRIIDGLLMGRGKHCEFGFEPVNLNTGNFYMDQTDISIPDLNGEFAITRSYNSKSFDVNSMFGRGWQFDFAEQITKRADGSIAYRRGDGSTVNFYADGIGGYVCDAGYYLQMSPIVVGTKTAVFDGIYEENIDNENVEAKEKYTATAVTYNVYEYEIKDTSGEVRRFGSDGHLISVTDKKGFKTTLNYSENGLLSSIVSAGGTTYEISCDSMGRIIAVSVPGGTIRYAYSDAGDLVGYTDENGNTINYNYDNEHKMTSWIDADGRAVTTNEYDSEGRVTKQTDYEGNVNLFAYAEGKTTTTDANGNQTVYNYDDQYRTTSIVYADGSAEYKYYDTNNNLIKEVDRSGNYNSYEYNSDGLLAKTTRSIDGASQSYEYNENNDIVRFTDYDGKSTTSVYNGFDLVSSTDKNGNSKSYTYDDKHRVLKITDENGNTSSFAYGDIWASEMTDANGSSSSYYYNGRGQVITMVDALGQETRFMYDAAGRKTGVQYADGTTETYLLEKSGSVKELKNTNNKVYKYTTDGVGNTLSVTDPVGGVIEYTYDGLYNQTSVKYPNGSEERTTYDAFGNRLSKTDAEGGKFTYSYDQAGNVLAFTDAMENRTEYTYDLRFNKPASMTDALNNRTEYTYDNVGNLTKIRFANETEQTYEYDGNGNVVREVAPNGLVTVREYDAAGNLLKESNSAGTVVEYTYDQVYNKTSVTYNGESTIRYTYDALGRILTETDASGSTTSYTYDAKGNIIKKTDAIGRSVEYEYDGAGNIVKETAPNGGVTIYTRDALDRVVKTVDPLGNTTTVEYDSVGNAVAKTDALGYKTQTVYNKNGLPVQIKYPTGAVTRYNYDKNGNLIKTIDAENNVAAIEYDALNRPVKTVDPLGLVTEMTYDCMGNLIRERNNDGTDTAYEFDASGKMISETDALGQRNEYAYDLNGNLTRIDAYDGTSTVYTYDRFNNRTSVTYPDNTKDTYTYDLLGNVTAMSKNGRTYTYAYDAANRMVSVTDPLSHTTGYEYNTFDLVTKITAADGNSTTNEYDESGNLTATVDANGNRTAYTYNAAYQLTTAEFADGSSNVYAYDEVGNLLSFVDNNGNKTQYKYSPLGNTTAIRAANGSVTKFVSDASGNILTETDALDNTTRYSYSKSGRMLSRVLANGATYTAEYDALGRVVKETEPVAISKEYTYDAKGDVSAITDQSGRTVSYTYDAMHRVTSSTDAAGGTTRFVYDVNGNLTSMISPKGAVNKYTYNDVDQVVSETDPMGKLSEYEYDPVGNLQKITETGGRVTSYTFDKVGNVLSETNAKGLMKSYTYDAVYNRISETDYKGNAVRYTFDKNGNLTSSTDRLEGKSVYAYDAVNNLVSFSDPEARQTQYAYDELNRLTAVTEDGSIVSEYTYDEVGNVTFAAGYTYTYDLAGNVTSSTDALGNVTSYIYNKNGLLETVKNADGSKVNYDYDELDRLVKKAYDKDDIALYAYDADGNRISMDDVAGTTGYEYDENGRITAVKLSNGTSKIGYKYDVYGNITKLTYPDGTCVGYKYDELDRLVAITNRANETTAYKYDENGNVTEVHRPNGTYTLLSYDKNDRVTEVLNYGLVSLFGFNNRTVLLSSYKYTYDKSGNIASETKSVFTSGSSCDLLQYVFSRLFNETVVSSYAYDGRNQLICENEKTTKLFTCRNSATTTYEYDRNGNRVSKASSVDGVTKYEYNKAGQLVRETSGKSSISYSYDKNGNLIEKKSTGCGKKTETYSYNNENKLTAVKEGKSLLLAALYDGDGNRIFTATSNSLLDCPCCNDKNAINLKKDSNEIDIDDDLIINTLFIPNGVSKINYGSYDVTGYINDVNTAYTQVLMEYGANEKVTAAYEYGVFRESAKIDGDQYYYEYDGRGSVAVLTNSKGKSVTAYDYDAYGNATYKGKNVANPYGYNAEYTDDATDLQYLRARYYNPASGTFTSADSYIGQLASPLSLNRYIYGHNNPLNGMDPSGNSWLGDAWNGAKNWVNKNVVQPVKSAANWVNNNVIQPVKNFVVDTYNNVKNKISSAVNTVKGEIKKFRDDPIGTLNSYKEAARQRVEQARQVVVKKLCEGKEKLAKVVNDVKDWAASVDWKKVGQTALIVGGAVLAVAAVVGTGGVALAPMLGALGMSAGAAATVSTVVAGVAVASTVASSTLNVIDTWEEIDDPTFNAWQKGLNITAAVSNGLYSIGNTYNSIKGVSGKEWLARQKAIENGKMGYGNLSTEHPNIKIEEGREFTKTQKDLIREENMRRNGGVLRDDLSGKKGTIYNPATDSSKPLNALEVDHIIPKTKGGTNDFSNARLIDWKTNLIKSNDLGFELSKSIGGIEDVGSISKAFGSFTIGNFKTATDLFGGFNK